MPATELVVREGMSREELAELTAYIKQLAVLAPMPAPTVQQPQAHSLTAQQPQAHSPTASMSHNSVSASMARTPSAPRPVTHVLASPSASAAQYAVGNTSSENRSGATAESTHLLAALGASVNVSEERSEQGT